MTEFHTSSYDPNRLLDAIAARLGASSDKRLSRMLQVSHHLLRAMRSGRAAIHGSFLIWIAERVGASVDELRRLLGDRRSRLRMPGQMRPLA